MLTPRDWEIAARELVKEEMAAKQLSYRQLSERLAAVGVNASEGSLRVKIMRGRFTAAFLLQCLEAIGSTRLKS